MQVDEPARVEVAVAEVPVELGEAVKVDEAVADGGQAAAEERPGGEEGES